MSDVPADVPSGTAAGPASGVPAPAAGPSVPPARATATGDYTRVFAEQQPRLVAYARSLTGHAWVADDLVAEAHFRVWRRLSAGHEIENVPAYLMTTVRHLAATVGRGPAGRETPHDPQAPEGVWGTATGESPFGPGGEEQDPAARISSVDLLTRVLGQLPERWVKALWLAEAEGQPLETIGRRIGAGRGATAVLLHRAREGMRQAFLRAHPGTPADPACETHWDRMPGHIRGEASPRQSDRLLAHLDTCEDCRARLALLSRANDRLPALTGPALLILAIGGPGAHLLTSAAGTASAGAPGHAGGPAHGIRHVITGGGKVSVAAAGAVGTAVAGAAVAAALVLGGSGHPAAVPPQRVAAVESAAPQPSAPPRRAAPEPDGTGEARGTGDSVVGSGRSGDHPNDPSGPNAPHDPSGPRGTGDSGAEAGKAPDSGGTSKPPRAAGEGAGGQALSVRPTEPPQTTAEPQAAGQPGTPAPTASEGATGPAPAPPVAPPPTRTPSDPATPAQPPAPTPTPTDPAPTRPTPVDPTPVPPTPTDPTPVDPTPVDPAPTDPPSPEPPVCEPWIGPILLCHTS
ncbi:zf-HC2 domain-containing protein [Streptomyces sp. NPDC047123]|uniref:zf-HC2 domain-containing protein n=1 Tax=Streptomyces sp. NPDC047123 TaxID=3155622 RepID=UPI0033D18D93